MRISTCFFYDLLLDAKKQAAEKGRTLSSIIEKGLKLVLTKPHLPVSKASGGTLPKVDLNRSSDLEDRMSGA